VLEATFSLAAGWLAMATGTAVVTEGQEQLEAETHQS